MGDIRKYGTERDIAEKVYLLAFVYPGKYNIYQMDELIFGQKCNRSYRAIKNTGYMDDDIIYRESANRKGRKEKLLTSSFIPIMDDIEYRLNTELDRYPNAIIRYNPDEIDWRILEDKFNTRFFKHFLEKELLNKIRDSTPGFDAVDYILERFDRLMIAWDQKPILKKLTEWMETNEYSTGEERMKQYYAEIKRLKLKLKSIMKNNIEWKKLLQSCGLSYTLFTEYILFFRFPLKTINKFKWLSEFGSMYYHVEPYLQKVNLNIDIDFLLK